MAQVYPKTSPSDTIFYCIYNGRQKGWDSNDFWPTHSTRALKAKRTVKRITFTFSEANLNEPKHCALRFNIDLTGGQNVSRAPAHKFTIKYAGTTLHDTSGYDIIFWGLFLPPYVCENNMLLEGIQTKKLCKIHLNAGNKSIGCGCCQALAKAAQTHCVSLKWPWI